MIWTTLIENVNKLIRQLRNSVAYEATLNLCCYTFWKIPRDGNVLETSIVIRSTMESVTKFCDLLSESSPFLNFDLVFSLFRSFCSAWDLNISNSSTGSKKTMFRVWEGYEGTTEGKPHGIKYVLQYVIYLEWCASHFQMLTSKLFPLYLEVYPTTINQKPFSRISWKDSDGSTIYHLGTIKRSSKRIPVPYLHTISQFGKTSTVYNQH